MVSSGDFGNKEKYGTQEMVPLKGRSWSDGPIGAGMTGQSPAGNSTFGFLDMPES